MSLNESIVEEVSLAWFGVMGYGVGQGPQVACGDPVARFGHSGYYVSILKSGEFCGLGFAGVKAEAGLELGKF